MQVLACTDTSVTMGEAFTVCPSSKLIWVDASPWEQLTYQDASLLLGAFAAALATAWGFRKVLEFIGLR